jgi:hypothetical protein
MPSHAGVSSFSRSCFSESAAISSKHTPLSSAIISGTSELIDVDTSSASCAHEYAANGDEHSLLRL